MPLFRLSLPAIAIGFILIASLPLDSPANFILSAEQHKQNWVPGHVELEGQFRYYDPRNELQPARGTTVEIWDQDYPGDGGADDLLETLTVDCNGFWVAPDITNWDEDGTSPDPAQRRLDIYIRWKTVQNDFKVTRLNGSLYVWQTQQPLTNIESTRITLSSTLLFNNDQTRAMWVFQDLRRTREHFQENTSPFVEPGFLTAHWERGINSENAIPHSHFWGWVDPHVFIEDNSVRSSDTVIHEVGHHIMYNKTGYWFVAPACWSHGLFQPESPECAWYEGWADFLPLAVNNDRCYDDDEMICGDGSYDLENITRNDPFDQGDTVEGRVAGALYDLLDTDNEFPWYDSAAWGFDWIADLALANPVKTRFIYFYYATSPPYLKHDTLRAFWQNTIDYDNAPVASAIPQVLVLQNAPWINVINLWAYTGDPESEDPLLIYTLVSQSPSNCGVSFNANLVSVNPATNWVGSCTVTYRVSDTLKNITASFSVQVVQVTTRRYLPVVQK